MTLILSCLTRDVVYQISDRRLTWSLPPRGLVDDESNKAVVVAGRVVFGYTGLAQIGDERTDLWLARVLADGPSQNMAQVAERLRTAATETFRRLRCDSRLKRQAFQGAGWFRLRWETELTPGLITVENAIDHTTGQWLPVPKAEFTTTTLFPMDLPGGCVLRSVGLSPTPPEKAAVVRLIRKCVKHRTSTPHTVVRGLVMAMHWLSRRYEPNSPIGLGLMAVSLPRRSVEVVEQTGHMALFAGPPDIGAATFLYISATGSEIIYGPHIVMEGIAAIDFQGGSF